MFVYWRVENAGSAQTLHNYAQVAKTMGHEVVLFGPDDDGCRFTCSRDVESADAVVFLLEWNIYVNEDEYLDIAEPLQRTPRERRVIIDNDGMYNEVIRVDGDYNHPHESSSRRRIELYEQIADKICQPTLHPRRPNVRPFLFHGYNRALERPLEIRDKDYGMCYVGSNWFRWQAMRRVLQALEPIRDRVGRIGLVGHNWDAAPWWVQPPLLEAYQTDPDYLRELGVEVMPPVPIDEVVATMSRGRFTPVLVRPLFNHLRLANPRLFETPAANTIPLFGLDAEYVEEIYGGRAGELVLGEAPSDKIEDVLRRPDRYTEIVQDVRRHLAENHSCAARLQELIDIAQS
jgi:hypothetical protein